MVISLLVLVVSVALFFFYIQAFCETALKREFSRAYFQDVLNAVQLEYPRLRDSIASKAFYNYSDTRHALKCDFMTLDYLLKNTNRSRQHLPRHERAVVFYFRFLLFCLPIRHAFRFHEKEAVLRLTTILQFFSNSVGEKLSANSFATAPSES